MFLISHEQIYSLRAQCPDSLRLGNTFIHAFIHLTTGSSSGYLPVWGRFTYCNIGLLSITHRQICLHEISTNIQIFTLRKIIWKNSHKNFSHLVPRSQWVTDWVAGQPDTVIPYRTHPCHHIWHTFLLIKNGDWFTKDLLLANKMKWIHFALMTQMLMKWLLQSFAQLCCDGMC